MFRWCSSGKIQISLWGPCFLGTRTFGWVEGQHNLNMTPRFLFSLWSTDLFSSLCLPKKSGHEFFSVGDLFRDKQEQWGVKHSGDNLTGPGPQNVVISVEIIQISMVDWVNPNTRQYSKFGNFWYSGIMIC